MHSAFLRNSEFEIYTNGQLTPFAEFADKVTNRFRLGIYAPNGYEGIGAATMIMAYVTAFYDLQRLKGEEFHIYPEFFTFQTTNNLADYSMFDIWPEDKNVKISSDLNALIEAVSNYRLDILLVPIESMKAIQSEPDRSPLNDDLLILPCISYSSSGAVENSDIIVRCYQRVLIEWSQTVLDSISEQTVEQSTLPALFNEKYIEQSFRRLSFQQFLTL